MKKLILVCLVLITTPFIVISQNLLVANNNPGAGSGVNVFTGATALQDAHAAAVNGDIIYVVPSQVSYGTMTISKELTIFGIGFRPTKDLANKSVLNQINLNSSNVTLSGLIVEGDIDVGLSLSGVTLSNITIENSRFGRVEMGSANGVTLNNLLARNNIVEGNGGVATSFLLYVTSNVTITNNIIFTSCCTAPSMRVTGAMITYNTFISDNRGIDAELDNNTFDHNIFYGTNLTLQSTSDGNVWTNNISFGSSGLVFGAGAGSNGTISGNIENMDPLFTDVPITRNWSDSHDFTLQAGSPALSTAPLNLTTEDMGPSGGPTPFDPEGNLLPLIQSVTIPSVIPAGTDLPVTIKAKGN